MENGDIDDSMVFAKDKNNLLELASWLGGRLSKQNFRDTGHLLQPLALRKVTNY